MNRRHTYLLIIIFILSSLVCGPKGAASPDDVVKILQKAFQEKKPDLFLSALTPEAKLALEENMKPILAAMETAPENVKKGFAEKMGLSVNKLEKMTLEDYVRYGMYSDNENSGTLVPVNKLNLEKVKDKKINSDSAIYDFGENIRLFFKKKDGYWFLDLGQNFSQDP